MQLKSISGSNNLNENSIRPRIFRELDYSFNTNEKRLQPFEQDLYKLAIERKYLVVDVNARQRLLDLWQSASSAQGLRFIVLEKNPESGIATVFVEGKVYFRGYLLDAKNELLSLLK